MTDQPDRLLDNLDTETVCRCPRCVRRLLEAWPDWAEPRNDRRPIEVVVVAGGRL